MAADLSTAKRLHVADVECGAKRTLDLCENTHGSAYHAYQSYHVGESLHKRMCVFQLNVPV